MGRAPCCEDHTKTGGGLKKGAWTAEEDEKLVSFIERNHGHHGSWRTLPHLAGLQRCGKSCRLRWTNYLRPNIKRGNFTADEERVIIQLHALVGNKWSNIASHLPGRTDNEVKNHWNTHLKKHLSRMGIDPVTHLPINDILIHLKNHKTPPQALNSQLYVNQNTRTFLSPYPNSNWNSRPYVITQPFPMAWVDQNHMAQWECARLEAEARLAAMSSCEVRRISSSIQNTSSSSDNQAATYNYVNTSASDHSQRILSSLIELPDVSVPASAATKQFEHNSNHNLQNLLIPPVVCSSNSTSSASSCMSDQFEFSTHEPLLLSLACETCSRFDCGTTPAPTLSVPMASSGACPDLMIPAALPDDDLQSAFVGDICPQVNNYWARMLSLVGPVSTSSICSSRA